MKKILLVMILIAVPAAYAEEIELLLDVNDDLVSIECILDSPLSTGETHKNLFRIRNLEYDKGEKHCLNITVEYSIDGEEDSVEVDCINSYRTSSTGYFRPLKPGTYDICGVILGTRQSCCMSIEVTGQEVSISDESIEDQADEQDDDQADDAEAPLKFRYDITDLDDIFNGIPFNLTLEVTSDENCHEIEVWSYVYRGNKCYSGEREGNKQGFSLEAGEKLDIILQNTVVAEPGDYKLKVKLRKDEQKTTKDLTRDVTVKDMAGSGSDGQGISSELDAVSGKQDEESDPDSKDKGVMRFFSQDPGNVSGRTFVVPESYVLRDEKDVIFESVSRKARKLVNWFIIGFALLLLALIWKKDSRSEKSKKHHADNSKDK
ncbi:hypothetical protein GF351_01895 [Candidatus Woesearchaeota archaeon]|nr:hypothetical protein [Candidatus Woesearchaeota archaeon]